MDDLIQKLRDTPCNREPFTDAHADCQCRTANAAADEIERLREIEKLWVPRDETTSTTILIK